mgnify:CR=1 FL=1
MKAAVYREFGGPEVVTIEEMEKPSPKDDEVCIRVRSTTVSTGDWRLRSSILPSKVFWLPARAFMGFSKPRKPILGMEASGVIEAVGKTVTRFKVGDEVFLATGMKFGGHAEYVCIAQDGPICLKPANASFDEAAAICFGAGTALFFLRDLGKIKKGDRVLINGAAGSVGTATVQLAARHYGAEVTAVCGSSNVELLQSLGARRVIDYTKEDLTRSGETYDIILDTVGKVTFSQIKPLLKKGGRFLPVVNTATEIFQMIWTPFIGDKKVRSGVSNPTAADLEFLRTLMETGKLRTVIGGTFPLARIVEAYRIVDSGHKRGNAVITVSA